MGARAASGTIFSAIFEIGSRALVSCTEAKARLKDDTAGRTASDVGLVCAIAAVVIVEGVHTYPP